MNRALRTLRIVFLSPYPPLPVFHGAVRRIWSLATHLARMGNDITIICKSDKKTSLVSEGVRIVSCPNLGSQYLSKLGNLNMAKELIKLNSMHQVDIVQCEFPYMFPPSFGAKLFGKPLILDEHRVESLSLEEDCYNTLSKIKAWLITFIEKTALEHSDLIFACSRIDAKRICQLYGIPMSKVVVIPNGADDSLFQKVESYEYSRPTVLFLGGVGSNRYAIMKLLQEIIPFVSKRLKQAQFAFVGRTDGYPLVSSENVLVHGQVEDVRPYIYGSCVCVAPIYQRSTGTRLKILEYMACRKPVVATTKAVEGLEGIRDGENIIIRDEIKAFSHAVIDLLNDESERERIGQLGFNLVEQKYKSEGIAKKAMECYEHILVGRS